MLYETDYKNKIKSASFAKDFSHNFDIPMQGCMNPLAEAVTRCTHISCKMLSPRKFIIKPRLQLNLDVFGNEAYKTVDTESGDNTYFKTTEIAYEKKLNPYTEKFTFEEELPLLQNEKNIGEIVFGNIRLQPPQVTMSGNDAIIKSNAVIKLLYEEEGSDNELVMTTKTLPLSMTLSNLEIDESGKIEVILSVSDEKLSSELDAYGENRIIKASFIASAKADMSEKTSEVIATDLFSSDYINKTESATIALPEQYSEFDRTFTIDTSVTPERAFVFPLFDTEITINELKTEIAEGGVVLSGSYTVSVLGRTADIIDSCDFNGEFNEFIAIDLPKNVTAVEAELYPFDYSSTMMSDGNLSLRIILNATIKTFTEENATIISSVLSEEPLAKGKESFAVIYYFPNSQDTLWSISKRYYVDPDSIKEANPNVFDENEQLISGTKMVLIKK